MKRSTLLVGSIVVVAAIAGGITLAFFGWQYLKDRLPFSSSVSISSSTSSNSDGDILEFPFKRTSVSWMQTYILNAFADAVGLPVDEVQTRLENGETYVQIAESKGLTSQQISDLLVKVRDTALDQAVKDGKLTQAQADVLKKTMHNFGFGMGWGMGDDNTPNRKGFGGMGHGR